MQHIKNIETNTKTIIHTNHGLQYSSEHFRFMCQKKGWIQSMSRIGNSLDNRENWKKKFQNLFITTIIWEFKKN